MRIDDFKKLLKTKEYKKIIAQYTHNKIYLTDKQLSTVIELKNKKEQGWRRNYGKNIK